jgi:hypothetical protein
MTPVRTVPASLSGAMTAAGAIGPGPCEAWHGSTPAFRRPRGLSWTVTGRREGPVPGSESGLGLPVTQAACTPGESELYLESPDMFICLVYTCYMPVI